MSSTCAGFVHSISCQVNWPLNEWFRTYTIIYNNSILLDAAQLEDKLSFAKELNKNHSSLYKGRSEEDLADVAPYLFTFEKQTEFANWYIENGWGNAWGLLVQSDEDFEIVYKHFRRFLLVKTEDEQELYFRFYDPRVLRIFLPTCDINQLKEFFGPVDHYVCEDEDPAYGLVFSINNNSLQTQRITKQEVFGMHGETKSGRKFFV